MKISKFNVSNAIALKNEKTKKNAMTKNQKFEQIEQTKIIQNKKKYFLTMLSITTTHAKKNLFVFIKNRMIKRLIEYLTIERRTEYIQYKSSLKSNNARDYINYSTLKAISIKISTFSFAFMSQ